MARALQKHVARRQDQTFADWFAELKVGGRALGRRGRSGADCLRGMGRRRDARASPLHGGVNSPAKDSGGVITSPCREPGRGFSRIRRSK
jgi:hypothetical protein